MDRDHPCAPIEDPSWGGERSHVPKQIVALGRPHREGADARPDRSSQGRHRFAARDRDTRRRRRHVRCQTRLRDHEIGLELYRRLDDLALVCRRRDDADRARSVQEVQDLVEHLGRLDGEHHARLLFHRGPSSGRRRACAHRSSTV
jgi:hypothetical protein